MDNNTNRNTNRNNSKNDRDNKNQKKNQIIGIVVALVAAFLFTTLSSYIVDSMTTKEISYNQFIALLENNNVESVVFNNNKIEITPKDNNGNIIKVKYVFVTGGVVSGLGKGITAASLGRLLKARGYKVTSQKFDPYINMDPGTMNPIQHGEVFVTDDGAETDLDLGHYERFIDESLTRNSNVTTGKVYWSVLEKERHGDFGGGTVQVIPHITNEIKSRFHRSLSEETEIAIIEVGGTVGDIESQPYIEAIRQFQHDVGRENCILIHVALMVYLPASEEMKTKPIQMSVKELQKRLILSLRLSSISYSVRQTTTSG